MWGDKHPCKSDQLGLTKTESGSRRLRLIAEQLASDAFHSLIRLCRTNSTDELTFLLHFLHCLLQGKEGIPPTSKKVAICSPNVSANWKPNGYSVIKNPIQAYAKIRASETIMSLIMLLRGSVGGNNPTAVASVMANTAHLLCLISRAPLRVFNTCVCVETSQ